MGASFSVSLLASLFLGRVYHSIGGISNTRAQRGGQMRQGGKAWSGTIMNARIHVQASFGSIGALLPWDSISHSFDPYPHVAEKD